MLSLYRRNRYLNIHGGNVDFESGSKYTRCFAYFVQPTRFAYHRLKTCIKIYTSYLVYDCQLKRDIQFLRIFTVARIPDGSHSDRFSRYWNFNWL